MSAGFSEFIQFKIKNTHYQVLQAAFNGRNFMVAFKGTKITTSLLALYILTLITLTKIFKS
jgi:hypothetical protein